MLQPPLGSLLLEVVPTLQAMSPFVGLMWFGPALDEESVGRGRSAQEK